MSHLPNFNALDEIDKNTVLRHQEVAKQLYLAFTTSNFLIDQFHKKKCVLETE